MQGTTANAGHDVSFGALIEKVKQAETALEDQERQTAASWRQLKAAWLAGWTPARIVFAGFLSGFAIGKAEPMRVARGGGALQLLSAVAGLFAGGSAQAAAGEAEDAAKSAQQTAAAVSPEAALAASAQQGTPPQHEFGDA